MNKHQFGIVAETVYGTPVVVDRFMEIQPGESLGRENTVIQSTGLRPTLRSRLGSRRNLVRRGAGGGTEFEVMTTSFGLLFEHMLGGTGGVVQQGTTTAYLHTYTPGDIDGKSLTLQKGVEQNDGTAQGFTYHGAKVLGWSFSIAPDGICMLNVDWDCEDEDDSTALAAASYASGLKLFHFDQAALKIGAATIANVSDATISGANSLNTDRYYLGTAGVKKEPLENDYRTYDGTLTAEFANLTDFQDLFQADTSAQLILEFLGDVIDTTFVETLRITVEDVRFTGETPKIAGPEFAVQALPWEAWETDAGLSVKIEYMTSDVAV